MADFLTRLAGRTIGLTPTVQPLISPMYAPGSTIANNQLVGWPQGPAPTNEDLSGGLNELHRVPPPHTRNTQPARTELQNVGEQQPGAIDFSVDQEQAFTSMPLSTSAESVSPEQASSKRRPNGGRGRDRLHSSSRTVPTPQEARLSRTATSEPSVGTTSRAQNIASLPSRQPYPAVESSLPQETHLSQSLASTSQPASSPEPTNYWLVDLGGDTTSSSQERRHGTGQKMGANLFPDTDKSPRSRVEQRQMKRATNLELELEQERQEGLLPEQALTAKGTAYPSLSASESSTRYTGQRQIGQTTNLPGAELEQEKQVGLLPAQTLAVRGTARPQPSAHESSARYTAFPLASQHEAVQESSSATPTIQVTIGRIEVRATPPQPARSPAQHTAASVMSLDDYVNQRMKGER